jgi:putative copper export protein/methionine-rich copper-binding protein CopC
VTVTSGETSLSRMNATSEPKWGRGRWAACAFVALLLLLGTAGSARAHIRLDRSDPGANSVVEAAPAELRLEFSGPIEARYTRVTVTAPDGSTVATGSVIFVEGSDRIITVALPPVATSGTYTVRWRTAGADGHVLEGSYAFELAVPGRPAETAAVPAQDTAAAAVHDMSGHHDHAEPETVGSALDVVGRGLHFLALILAAGAVTLRSVLLPRLRNTEATGTALQRRAWQALAAAALLLAAAAVLRLWLQSVALHGAERAWSTPLLSIMLRDTGWGRAWVAQVFLFAVLGAAIAWARPARDRFAAALAFTATAGLCTIPALSGHAAGATGAGRLIVVNDAVHVFAAGAWIGTLALLLFIVIPRLARDRSVADAADAVDAFSPLALAAAALVAASGAINTLAHLNTPAELWTTEYGRTLLVKLAFVALVALMGFVNWRFVRPHVRATGSVGRLRLAASGEVAFAVLVLAATAVLTGQPRP